MKRRFKRIYNNFKGILKKPEMRILPGQLSYFFLMSLIPILTICTILVSLFTSNVNVISIIEDALPQSIFNIIMPFLDNSKIGVNVLLFLIAGLLLASNGPYAVTIASNNFYKVKHSRFLKQKIKSLIMTVIIIILLLFIIFIPIFGDVIVKFLLNLVNNPDTLIIYMPIYKFLKVIISFVFIYFCIKLLYTIAPDSPIKSRTTTMGAIFTTLCWIIVTEAFGFYITEIADYNALYGNFANILILLLWVYLLSYLFMIGMAININAYELAQIKNNEQ